jgi:DNA-3-methyladenine glycosylase I
MKSKSVKQRCVWVTDDPVYIQYHDKEWGVPVYDEQHLFEMLNLEGMQAGLSWLTILKRRDHYRRCFHQFDAKKIARFDEAKVARLMQDPGIIRHQLKIEAIITNANAYLTLKKELGSFSDYIWQFVDHEPIVNRWKSGKSVPAKTSVSDAMAKDLKKRGFKFVGSTICYAFMQAVGMVNDHTTSCFCCPRDK